MGGTAQVHYVPYFESPATLVAGLHSMIYTKEKLKFEMIWLKQTNH